MYADENVWITQKMMGLLYDIDVKTINYHLKKVFSDRELEACAVIRNFRITASDGKQYNTQHYNLAAIIAIGYKVNFDPLLKNGCAAKRTFWHKWRLWMSSISHRILHRIHCPSLPPSHSLPGTFIA